MIEYKPKVRRKGINIPFGYYVSPFDQKLLLPDPKKLDALHYAYRMKAKYQTPLRDCTQWLHAATGQRMSPAGFMYAYKAWSKRLKKERAKEMRATIEASLKKQQQFYDENFKHLGVVLDDRADITALAHDEAKKAWKKKESNG